MAMKKTGSFMQRPFHAISKPRLIKSGRILIMMLVIMMWPQLSVQSNDITFSLVWSSLSSDSSYSVAWGDVDGDGDLDMAVGNSNAPNRLYRNDSGVLTAAPVWSSNESDTTRSVAWGDVDGDGDLDLAVGNLDQPNRLYRNDNGVLTTTSIWSSNESDATYSVAWGDVDGDNRLELAAGNSDQPNRLYHNQAGSLSNAATWSSTESDTTLSVAWGDYDGDGFHDLAAGNGGQPNRIYHNENGILVLSATWSSAESDATRSVAWGDADQDGDLDMAVGNWSMESNRLYRNDGVGTDDVPVFSLIWSSNELEHTNSVSWGDFDNDGDPDLAAGNGLNLGLPNRIYTNVNGTLSAAATWSSDEADETHSMAWGDYDNDGDLDLMVGNINFDASRLYRNNGEFLTTTPVWSVDVDSATRSVAWGDVDGDGDLDLAIGNRGEPNRLYRNDSGILTTTPVWSSSEADGTTSIAWGDVDRDGDLDLAVGNSGEPNRIYRNNNGVLGSTAFWSSNESNLTQSVVWGDVDDDGDLDLAVGNSAQQPNQLYRSNNGVLATTAVWTSAESDTTLSLAWGDIDNDGDLDLVVGNSNANRLYRNDGGTLTENAVWSSAESDFTWHVALGDVDGDGDLDLMSGNSAPANRLYRNDNGVLTTGAVWSSAESDSTSGVAWGDVDGDGDLDLAVGNWSASNYLHRNEEGVLTTDAVWASDRPDLTKFTWDVAWGDVDRDGDLDLAVGDDRPDNVKLYQNLRRQAASLINNPPAVSVSRPGITDDAAFFSTGEILQTAVIPIPYTLFDPESDIVPKIFPEYSVNGGGQWLPATPGDGGDGVVDLATSPQGTAHIFAWDAASDLIKSDNIVFRMRVQPGFQYSPILWPAVEGKSPSFRAAAPWTIKVIDDTGLAVSGASVYAGGQVITETVTGATVTDQAGLLSPGPLDMGVPLIALDRRFEQPTLRDAHDGWAYRVFRTSLQLDADGVPHPFMVAQSGEQRLVVRPDNPLILFNLVVSIEWNADDVYLDMVERAFENASDTLYDVSDGQMAFGQVTIYDESAHWADADFQISTKNTVRPYAFIGGIASDDTAHAIRIGRFWDGGSGNQGNWDQPRGYRTLIHEFGHYALYLHDEYFVRVVENGRFVGQQPAACTGLGVIGTDDTPTNASIMYYQYNTSELADTYNWTTNCQNTEQGRMRGEPDWQTILAFYGGSDWQLNTPSTSRDGQPMPGPAAFPVSLLPFPVISRPAPGNGGTPREITVVRADMTPYPHALVALYTTRTAQTVAIDQGMTDQQGEITIYGAVAGDIVQVASFDGALAANTIVDESTSYTLILNPTTSRLHTLQEEAVAPYLELFPGSGGDTLAIKLFSPSNAGFPEAIVLPGAGAGTPQSTPLAYSGGEGAYIGQVSFAGVGLGSGEVRVSNISGRAAINSNYNLFRVFDAQDNDLASEDGNLLLTVSAGSLLNHADAYAAIAPTGYLPKPLPGEQQLLGNAYSVRFSGAATGLTQPALLTMHDHPDVTGNAINKVIYYWNPGTVRWERIDGTIDEQNHAVTATITQFGVYALGSTIDNITKVYLPVMLNRVP